MLVNEIGSVNGLAARIGKSPTQVSQWMNGSIDSRSGKPRALSRQSARQIEDALGKPDGWMDQPLDLQFQFQGKAPARSSGFEFRQDVAGMADLISPPAAPEGETHAGDLATLPQFSTDDYVSVPYAQAKLSAGAHGFNIEYQQGTREPLYFLRSWFKSRGLNPRKVFAADLSGPSMQKSMPDGDTVLVNTDAQEPREDKVFAALYDGEMVIKRLRREDGAWWLISDNDDQVRFAPKRCDASCRLVGQVVLKMSETI